MPLLKMQDLKAMRQEELESKLQSLEDELMHERGVAAMGGAPPSPGRIRALRTNVARIRTVMRELEIKTAKDGGKMKEEKT
ncbi:MAG: 50S ribosomal protein L29 [Thermoplasmata archaeon]|nr:50S ribosomal protein L29 [Thermoplasmata archaeon]